MQSFPEFISITIDKSHIITIGERLYTESIEFVRELANNAYDADAALVEIVITEDAIEIRDNGAGMDREGLKQYFNIGSQQKLYSPKSPVYNRDRIGQFGIGKFASLSACKRFEVITKREEFEKMAADDVFLLWGNLTDNYYGTSSKSLQNVFDRGKIPLMIQGISETGPMKKALNDRKIPYIEIFISPLNREELNIPGGIDKALEILEKRMGIAGRNNMQGRLELSKAMLMDMVWSHS